jgi:hypothetical protein
MEVGHLQAPVSLGAAIFGCAASCALRADRTARRGVHESGRRSARSGVHAVGSPSTGCLSIRQIRSGSAGAQARCATFSGMTHVGVLIYVAGSSRLR